MKIEIKHFLDDSFPGGISRTDKTWRFLGVIVKRKIYNYPKKEYYECVTMI
jgi:hypothetical protein